MAAADVAMTQRETRLQTSGATSVVPRARKQAFTKIIAEREIKIAAARSNKNVSKSTNADLAEARDRALRKIELIAMLWDTVTIYELSDLRDTG
jgi:hypothetical protein